MGMNIHGYMNLKQQRKKGQSINMKWMKKDIKKFEKYAYIYIKNVTRIIGACMYGWICTCKTGTIIANKALYFVQTCLSFCISV